MMTANELIKAVRDIAALKTSYVWGGIGAKITEASLAEKVKQYPSHNQTHAANARRYLGAGYMFDCVCLIKAVLWGWTKEKADRGAVPYATNGVPDVSADGMIAQCREVSTDFAKIVPGEVVWMSGHIGVYIGDGKVVECTPVWANGVQITKLGSNGYQARKWTKHGKLPWVAYATAKPEVNHDGEIRMIVNGRECWVPGHFIGGTNYVNGSVREVFGAMGATIGNQGSTPIINI